MAVEVMAWNVLDAFSDEKRARDVLKAVNDDLRPDVAVFSEAWREDKGELLDDVLDEFARKKYTVIHGLYEDKDGREDRHGIMGIVRDEMVADQKPRPISLGSRNAIHIPVVNTGRGNEAVLDFFGAHLDDRTEERRLAQAEHLIAAASLSKRAIVGGDLNAMYRADPRAKALRVIRPIAKRLPSVEPRPDFKPPKLKRIGSLASRLTDMATGTTLAQFEAAGFRDTDRDLQGTKGPFNIDHMLVRGLLLASNHRTHPKNPASDHRAISASVYVLK